jgi:DNA-binding NarL/FixJ family response regulator
MNRIRVLIVDDHSVVRKGIEMLLSTEPSIHIVGEAASGQEAIARAKDLQPDVIVMDLVMPEGGGITAIAAIKGSMPNTRILVLTTFGDEDSVTAAMEAGADGYLLKDAGGEALLNSIRAVRRGDVPLDPHVARHLVRGTATARDTTGGVRLTRREMDVLRLVAGGLSNRQVAKDLGLSAGTVKVHVSNILGKLNVSTRTEAAVWAVRTGLVAADDGE